MTNTTVGIIALAVVVGAVLLSGVGMSMAPSSVQKLAAPVMWPVTEWEHGFKTSRVTATRYENKAMGYNIGFNFPKDITNADRSEVSDFFKSHDGWIYQGGGYAGATAYVKFKGVTDKETANAKLREILPPLSQVMADLALGISVKIVLPEPKFKWPDTEAPDKTNPYWEFNNNLNINGVPYKKIEVEEGRWQWKIDEESQQRMRKWEADKSALYVELRTRVLSDEEFERAKSLGLSLVTQNMVSYRENEKRRELDDAFAQQAKLRAIAIAR